MSKITSCLKTLAWWPRPFFAFLYLAYFLALNRRNYKFSEFIRLIHRSKYTVIPKIKFVISGFKSGLNGYFYHIFQWKITNLKIEVFFFIFEHKLGIYVRRLREIGSCIIDTYLRRLAEQTKIEKKSRFFGFSIHMYINVYIEHSLPRKMTFSSPFQ